MYKPFRLVITAFVLLLASPLLGQEEEVELTAYYGYRLSGNIGDVNIGDTDSFGLILGIPVGWDTHLELLWSEQQVGLTGRGSLGGRELFDADIEYFHIGGRRFFDDEGVRPFAAVSAGITYYKPEPANLSSESRFSVGFGGGALVPAGERLGLRLEGRAYTTFINAGGGIWCGPGGCTVATGGEVVWQIEGLIGLTLRFNR